MPRRHDEAWITGIGLVSSLGEGLDEHWRRLKGQTAPAAVVDDVHHAPYAVHPIVALDFAKQIPKTSDQRQMERWQRIGVYAAGLALADAKILGKPDILDKVDLAIAAGNGERDVALDRRVLQTVGDALGGGLNQQLMSGLRPTLYLGQLSNLLAGNISIVHKATGSSRTFKGEEMAGVAAIEDAIGRLACGQSELMLVGGALNAERDDLLLNLELGGALLRTGYRPVWTRSEDGGGMVPGSVGVFLTLETPKHARARGVTPYAKVAAVASDRSRRQPGDAADSAQRLLQPLLPLIADNPSLAVLSGASGVEPATREEGRFLQYLGTVTRNPAVRAYGSVLGHGIEAHFLSGVALAALAISKRSFYAPFGGTDREREVTGECRQCLVTAFGHWRGEALGLVEAISGAAP
jgi:3-oxoacyl-[acyl-carrier-protein] synthase II